MKFEEKINSFKELLNEIGYSWEYPNYDFIKDREGNFILNKLYIEPGRVSYKTSNYSITNKVFEEVGKFYNFLQSTET